MSSIETDPKRDKRNWWPVIHGMTSVVALLIIAGIAWWSISSQASSTSVETENEKFEPSSNDRLATVGEGLNEFELDGLQAPVPDVSGNANGNSQDEQFDSSEESPVPGAAEIKPAPSSQISKTPDSKNTKSDDTKTQDAENSIQGTNSNPESSLPAAAVDAPKFYDAAIADQLFKKTCSQCHKIDRIEKYEFDDGDAVAEILNRMAKKMEKKGLPFSDKRREFLDYYLLENFVRN